MSDINRKIEEAVQGSKTAEDKEIIELSQSKEKLAQECREERLVWVIVCFVLFDCFFLKDCHSWGLPVVIGLFQFIIALVLGQMWGASLLTLIFNKILESYKGNGKN